MPISDEQLAKLRPFIAGGQPDARGEIDMYCPLHPDTRRSASLNVNMGAWFCHAGCGGGSVRQLVDNEDAWVPAVGRVKASAALVGTRVDLNGYTPTVDRVMEWHHRLLHDRGALRWLWKERGLTKQTVRKAQIGFNGSHYKIPVFSPERDLWNVRTYDPKPTNGRRKVWSVRGMGRARLYPCGVLERAEPGSAIIFCEGEWDTLLALQTGYQAITRTDGAGKPWHSEWDVAFAGLRVYICQDRDTAGQEANRLIGDGLEPVAEEVRYIHLPFPLRPKDGPDLTDYLKMGGDLADIWLGRLLEHSTTEPEGA